MNIPGVAYGSLSITREFFADTQAVFNAWRNPEIKAKWFIGPAKWKLIDRNLRFCMIPGQY